MDGDRLPRAFFERDVVVVARELVGTRIVRAQVGHELPAGRVVLRITEVEAYRGPSDSAAHSRTGNTPRTGPMFGPAGHAYVYLCYGIHWMLNLVAGGQGEGAAVLVRACEVVEGLEVVLARRKRGALASDLLAGPGKVAQALALDTTFSGHDVTSAGGLELHAGERGLPLLVGPRIGIDFAKPKDRRALLRFALAGSAAVTGRATLRKPR